MDIENMINNMMSDDEDYNPYAMDSLTAAKARDLYKIRNQHIAKIVKEEGTTPKQRTMLKKLYDDTKTPFYYEPADSWKSSILLAEEFGLIIVLLAGFFAAGIFSDEFQFKADAIFFSTKHGRTKAVRAKIQAGLLITTVIYWTGMALFSLISFLVMGISGAGTPIQVEWCYGIYDLTYGEFYLMVLVCGYIASLLSAGIAMFISAKLHSATIATCVPFILFCVLPFLGRALPFPNLFHFTPDQLMNVYNSIRVVLVYQIGSLVFRPIPCIMIVYAVVTVLLLPLVYRTYHKYTIA